MALYFPLLKFLPCCPQASQMLNQDVSVVGPFSRDIHKHWMGILNNIQQQQQSKNN